MPGTSSLIALIVRLQHFNGYATKRYSAKWDMVVNKLCLNLYFYVNCPITSLSSLTLGISNLLEKYTVFKLVLGSSGVISERLTVEKAAIIGLNDRAW